MLDVLIYIKSKIDLTPHLDHVEKYVDLVSMNINGHLACITDISRESKLKITSSSGQ